MKVQMASFEKWTEDGGKAESDYEGRIFLVLLSSHHSLKPSANYQNSFRKRGDV